MAVFRLTPHKVLTEDAFHHFEKNGISLNLGEVLRKIDNGDELPTFNIREVVPAFEFLANYERDNQDFFSSEELFSHLICFHQLKFLRSTME